jgi:hypothetical protein
LLDEAMDALQNLVEHWEEEIPTGHALLKPARAVLARRKK